MMSYPKKRKTMKKLIYSLFAVALIVGVSCTKEAEAPVTPAGEPARTFTTYTFEGSIVGQTRTAYENFQKFSWKADDKISVFTYNEETEYIQISSFTAQEDGVTTTFVGEVEDGYYPSWLAVYPDEAAFVLSEPAVYLPSYVVMDGDPEEYYVATSDNPLQNLALVGHVNEEGTAYAFKTAMGAIKLTFTDLPAEAHMLRIYAPEKISGYFHVDENDLLTNESAVPGSFTYTDDEGNEHSSAYSRSLLWYHFDPSPDGSVTLYIPLPVGKLSAGTIFTIEDEEEEVVLFQKTTRKDIIIERNKVTELVPLKAAHEWVSLGKGKFIDNYLWDMLSFTTDSYVDVDIYQDSADPTSFRVVSPYGAAKTAFNYKAPTGFKPTGPDDLELSVNPGDLVDFKTPHNTGLAHPEYRTATMPKRPIETQLVHPGSGYLGMYDASHNAVVKYQANGLPAEIQLAPIYWWLTNANTGNGYWSGGLGTYYANGLVRILFPGVSAGSYDLDASVSYAEMVSEDPVNPIALVTAYLGIDLASAKIVIAASESEATAAFASGVGVTEITSSGEYEVALPENAPTGDYMVYLRAYPVDGFALSSGLLYSSAAFKYYSAAQDRNIQISDFVGTWTAPEVEMFFNPTYWDDDETNDDDNAYGWQEEQYEVTFVFAESDDEEAGDIMLVGFEETGVGFCGVDTPIYGHLDSAHGILSFDAHQPIYSFYAESAGTTLGIIFDDYMNDTHEAIPLKFEISEDLSSLTLNYEYFTYMYWDLDQDTAWGYSNIIMYSPVPLKVDANAAPRRVSSLRGNRFRFMRPESALPREMVFRHR